MLYIIYTVLTIHRDRPTAPSIFAHTGAVELAAPGIVASAVRSPAVVDCRRNFFDLFVVAAVEIFAVFVVRCALNFQAKIMESGIQ